MSETRIVVGNLLDQEGLQEAVGAGSEDPSFPAAFLHDGPGGLPWRSSDDLFGNEAITYNGNLVKQPAANWTVVAGAIEDSADHDHGWDGTTLGTSLKLNGAATSEARQTIKVRAGYRYKLEAWAGFTGVAQTAKVGLYDKKARLWYEQAGGGSWVASPTYVLTVSPADSAFHGAGSDAGVIFTVSPPGVVLGQETELQIVLITLGGDTGDAYFDDIQVFAGLDFVFLGGGHNIPAWMTIDWRSLATDGVTGTVRGTLTKRQHGFYLLLDEPVFDKFHFIRFGQGQGAPDVQVYVGDLVFGQTKGLGRAPVTASPIQLTYGETGQSRSATPAGTEWVANRSPYPPRTLTVKFRFPTIDEAEAARQALIDDLRGGETPCVFLPDPEVFPSLAIYGRIQQPLTIERSPLSMARAADVEVDAGTDFEDYFDLAVTIIEGPGATIDD